MSLFSFFTRGSFARTFLAAYLGFAVGGCTPSSTPQVQTDPEPAVEIQPPIDSKTTDKIAASTETAFKRLPEIANSIVIGLDADMSSGAALSGESIRRGAVLAIDEINEQGGVLGRPLELVIRDHRGNPTRGVDNINEFAAMDRLAAVLGGIHTPVALQELKSIHEHNLIYLDPWAAGTPIVENGYDPNFVFRLSVRDEYAGGFLINQALSRGHKRIGILLEQTGWGRSNEKAIKTALAKHELEPAGVEWFHWGARNLEDQLERLADSGAETVILISNPLEGIAVVKSMSKRAPQDRLPIISHWGISAGDFFRSVSQELTEIDLVFLQTYSFIVPTVPKRASVLVTRYCNRFKNCRSAREIAAPVGTAHAFDLIHIFRLAVEKAGTTESVAVRDAFERIEQYDGLLRSYKPPFTADRHDALNADDFCLARYAEDGAIVPISD